MRPAPPPAHRRAAAPLAAAVAVAVAIAGSACGNKSSAPVKAREDAGPARDATAEVSITAKPLGLPSVDAFDWRARAGHAGFREAQIAERHGDWSSAAVSAKLALREDPGNLEAAWLFAIALAKLGKHDALVAPLHTAVAGDFGKWGDASLQQPALQPFLSTPLGAAWRARVEEDRHAYLAALARALVVHAGGDLYAYDPETKRWHRLTRTFGRVVGALPVPSAKRIVYVAMARSRANTTPRAVGIIDLARGHTTVPIDLPSTASPIVIAYSTAAHAGARIGSGGTVRKPARWHRLDETNKLIALPAKTRRPAGPWLEFADTDHRYRAIPVPNVTADWDDAGLASAIRIKSSNRVVSVPSPGLIDGNTATWSPDRSRLAFIAQLDDECQGAIMPFAAFIADAATGRIHELSRDTSGLAIQWLDNTKLALGSASGVSLLDANATDGVTAEPTPIPGAHGLIIPRTHAPCAAPPSAPLDPRPPAPPAPPVDDDDIDTDPTGATAPSAAPNAASDAATAPAPGSARPAPSPSASPKP